MEENLLKLVSIPRLKNYKDFLGCNSSKEQLCAYFAYQELSSYFLPLIQLIEISLRNVLDKEISNLHGHNWYTSVPTQEKSKILVNNILNKLGQDACRDDIICRLTLGFWVYMVDANYRDTDNPSYIWSDQVKKTVFPKAVSIFNENSYLTAKAIFEELIQVIELRNRLFHHEPIWKKSNCRSHEDAISNLVKNFKFLKKILIWIVDDKISFMENILNEESFLQNATIDKLQSKMNTYANRFAQ